MDILNTTQAEIVETFQKYVQKNSTIVKRVGIKAA